MMWPFKQRAKNVSQPDLLSVLMGGLPAGSLGLLEDTTRTAALETAASMWSNALASASGPLPSDCLAWLGRELILRGQGVLLIDTSMGRLRFVPVWHVDIDGFGPFPEAWTYRCTVNSPDNSTYVRVSGSGVVHLNWATDPVRPWRGLPPWDTTTGAVLGSVEGRLKNEARTPFGYLLPSRDRRGSPTDDNAENAGFNFAGLNGKLVTTTGTPQEVAGAGQVANPQQRYSPIRLGMDLPQTLVQFRKDIERSVFLTCGVPPSLTDTSDGTSQRESYRRFCLLSVEPVLRRLSSELVAKLEITPAEAAFNIWGLWGHDLAGRAKAFQVLVAAGKSEAEASKLAGLMVPDDM